jgi:hypothetical protein
MSGAWDALVSRIPRARASASVLARASLIRSSRAIWPGERRRVPAWTRVAAVLVAERTGGLTQRQAAGLQLLPDQAAEPGRHHGGSPARRRGSGSGPAPSGAAAGRSGGAAVRDWRRSRTANATADSRNSAPVTASQRVQRYQQQVVADNRAEEPDHDRHGVGRHEPGGRVTGQAETGQQGEQVQGTGAVPAQLASHVTPRRSGWRPTWCCARRDWPARSRARDIRGRETAQRR